MARGLEPDADVGAGDDNGLAGEVVGWVRQGLELVVEEVADEIASSRLGWLANGPRQDVKETTVRIAH